MDDATYQALKEIISNLTLQNKQLRKANTKQKKKIRHLQKEIGKLREEQKGKQFYRNGRKRSKYGRK